MGGMESCCSQTSDVMHKEEDTLKNLALITDQDDFMNRIVQDASKQVKELKRQRTLQPLGRSPSIQQSKIHLSSIGENDEWSPRERSPANKKKGFVKLSSYDNQCFSSTAKQQQQQQQGVNIPSHQSRNSSVGKIPKLMKCASLKSKTNRFEDIEKVKRLSLQQKNPSISPVKNEKSPLGKNVGVPVSENKRLRRGNSTCTNKSS